MWAQSVDLEQVDLSMIELDKADLSQVKFYFNGPAQFLVRDVYYDGMYYAAVLDYDGQGTFSIKVPNSTSVTGLPMSLDLSKIDVSLTNQGLRLRNVVADGYRFSGELVPNPQLALEIDPPVVVLGPVEEAPAVATTDVDQLQRQVSQLRGEVRDLERQVDQQESAIAQREEEVQSKTQEVASKDSEISAKNREIARLERRIASLERQQPAAASGAMTPLQMAAQVDRTVKSGFSGGESVTGSWRASGSTLTQTDSGQLYAKYVVPVRQNASELVYQFSGNTTSSGWSGFGLHFLGSQTTLGQGYGYGSSYLVWVTKDPARTQTDQTFIQLYKSYDDVRMIQVASKAIDVPISRSVDVGVYVNRSQNTIYIGVNNEPVIEFTDANMYRSGTAVAARALGSARFSGLSVKAK